MDNISKGNVWNFKMTFSAFFWMISLSFLWAVFWIISHFYHPGKSFNRHNMQNVLPGALIFGTITWICYSYIFNRLMKYPINKNNDLGYAKNSLIIWALVITMLCILWFIAYFFKTYRM